MVILKNKSILCFALVAAFILTLASPAYAASGSLGQWSMRSSGTTNDFTGVTYGDGLFVATCYTNQGSDQVSILTSPDGATWTSHLAASKCRLYGVTYGNGIFVAVGTGTAFPETTPAPQGIISADQQSYGEEAGGAVLTSKDGVNWTQITGITDRLFGVTCGNGIFVAVGGNTVLTSTDGSTWTRQSLNISVVLQGICYGNGLFVAAGYEPDSSYSGYNDPYILTSPDGTTWTSYKTGTMGQLNSVTYGYGLFVAVGASQSGQTDDDYVGADYVATSPDGSTWTTQHSGTGSVLGGVAYGNGLFVAAGVNITNDTGNIWTLQSMDANLDAYLEHSQHSVKDWMFYLSNIQYTSEIQTSPDGVNWTIQQPVTSGYQHTSNTLDGVACGNGTFVAVGDNGTVIQAGVSQTLKCR